ncbi:MAG: tripartite tricarboxylate transporter permease [Atribacterota bacterium]|nr:tripartite tricarboxylate transporter permease [Atribacterota bacterium]
MEVLIQGFRFFITEPATLPLLVFGVLFGIIFGCIPGLTATLGIVLLIPFTYVMAAELGLALLIGIYVGGISGGLITAILLNIPGTPSSMVTCWDGYPMASKRGLPGQALSIGVFSSALGGSFSALALIFIAPPLSKIALSFGSWEYLAIMVLGMSVVVMMTSDNPLKGLIAALIGIGIGAIGIDVISGVSRLTFGFWQLQAGMNVVAISMAFFAVREIFTQVRDFGKSDPVMKKGDVKDKIPIFPPLEALKGTSIAFILGSIYGTIIGMLPGVGQTTAGMLAYNSSRQFSKHPEKYGTGISEGIVASETANNAVNGGALIPLLTLGIPGDMVTAVLIGGLMIQGIKPGPLLFRDNPGVVGTIMVAYLLSNIIMFILELGFMRIFVKISKAPLSILFPIILITCVLGVYALNNRVFDLWILAIFGIIGYLLTEVNVPMPPLILGYVLGQMIERTFRTAMYASYGDIKDIFNRPVAIAILLLAVFLTLMPYISIIKNRFFGKKAIS